MPCCAAPCCAVLIDYQAQGLCLLGSLLLTTSVVLAFPPHPAACAPRASALPPVQAHVEVLFEPIAEDAEEPASAGDAFDALANDIDSTVDSAVDQATSTAGSISGQAGAAVDSALGAMDSTMDAAGDAADSAYDAAMGGMDAAVDSAGSAIDSVAGTVSSAAQVRACMQACLGVGVRGRAWVCAAAVLGHCSCNSCIRCLLRSRPDLSPTCLSCVCFLCLQAGVDAAKNALDNIFG